MNADIDDLARRYLAGTAGFDEVQLDRLATALEQDADLAADLREGLLVDELLSAALDDGRQDFTARVLQARSLSSTRMFTRRILDRTRRVDRRRRQVAVGRWLAAALLLLGVALLAYLRPAIVTARPVPITSDEARDRVPGGRPDIAVDAGMAIGRLEQADRCRLLRAHAEQPLTAGMALLGGDRLLVDGSAILRLGDARLVLAADADLTLRDDRHLLFATGAAQVAVAHGGSAPADGIRLHLATAQATAQVTGTRFHIAATATWTRIRLTEGGLTLATVGSSAVLHPGEEAVVSTSGLARRTADDGRLRFALADADTDRLLPDHDHLTDGMTIPHRLLTSARLVPRILPAIRIASLAVRLDAGEVHVEAHPPWNVVRDRDGQRMHSGFWRPDPGWHLIEVTAHAQADTTGPPLAAASLLLHIR